MSAGTLTLTNNSDLVSGAGTSFSTELTAGDFVVVIVGGVTYTLPVKSVEGDTEITLISKYPGPTQQGSAWNSVPRATQNQVTAALVVQSTEALRGLNYDKQNWQAVFSVDGHITVMLPDGSSFSGPSWLSIANILNTLDVEYLDQLAAQIKQDAQQVEADKNTVVETAQEVSTDAQTASTAASGAQGSATDAAQSETKAEEYKELARKYALNPEDNPVTDSEYSALHYSEKARKSAEDAAAHNPAEALVKSLNLSDLADRAAAWLNVRPIGSTPLAGDAINPYDAPTLRQVENLIGAGGGVGPTLNGVQNFGVGENIFWQSRAFIPPWAVTQDGQLLNRADWPELWAHAQMHGAIDDSVWLGDPTQRGFYSTGDGSTTFRVPDKNGIVKNGVGGAVGDSFTQMYPGADSSNASQLMRSAGLPNISGAITLHGENSANIISGASGAFEPQGGISNQYRTPIDLAVKNPAASYGRLAFSARSSNTIYGNYEGVRPNTFFGVWLVRASGGFMAANTLWSVINEDAEMPPATTSADGGFIQSQYKVNGVVVSESRMRAVATVGGNYSTRITTQNVTDSKSAEWIFGDDGVLTVPSAPIHLRAANSDKAFRIDGFVRADSLFGIAAGAVGVMAAESNEIRLQNTGAGGSAGNYINWIRGNWYNGNWTIGGIRSSSTALQRVQMNITDGVGSTASYLFNPNGVAQATQWQNTSDRRVKSCIETIPDPLAVMRSMRGYSWYYEPYGTQGFGFMSDEAEKYFPSAVKTTEDFEVEMPDGSKIGDVKSVDTYGIAAALHHEAILVMMDQIAELKAEIKKLKGE